MYRIRYVKNAVLQMYVIELNIGNIQLEFLANIVLLEFLNSSDF